MWKGAGHRDAYQDELDHHVRLAGRLGCDESLSTMSNGKKGRVEVATYGRMVAMSMWPGISKPRLQRSTLRGDDGSDLNASRQDLSSHLA
jgi:hypothetical protein